MFDCTTISLILFLIILYLSTKNNQIGGAGMGPVGSRCATFRECESGNCYRGRCRCYRGRCQPSMEDNKKRVRSLRTQMDPEDPVQIDPVQMN